MPLSVIEITTGEPGTGKTYLRGAHWVATEFLPYQPGCHVSNFPLRVDKIDAYVRRRFGDGHRVTERLKRIPDEVFAQWIVQDDYKDDDPDAPPVVGPWDLLGSDGWPMAGTHLAVDEAHLVVPKAGCLRRRRAWRKWLSEVRHSGITVEFITQAPDRMDKDIRDLVEVRRSLVRRATDRDPYFKIPFEDWYELKALITREWNPVVLEFERRKVDGAKWEVSNRRAVELSSVFYDLYDSFSTPHVLVDDNGEPDPLAQQKGKREFQKRGTVGVLVWFFRRHWPSLAGRAVMVGVFIWLCLGGGLVWALNGFMDRMSKLSAPPTVQAENTVANEIELPAVELSAEKSDIPEGMPSGEPSEFVGLNDAFSADDVLYRLKKADGTTEDYTVGDFGLLLHGREVAEVEAEQRAYEAQVLEHELKAVRAFGGDLVMLGVNWAEFASGERVTLGSQIRSGDYAGRRVQAVDFRGRNVVLDDGSRLYVRVSDGRSGESLPGLPGGGVGSQGGGAASRGGGAAPGPRDSSGGPGSPRAIPPVPEPRE